MAKALKETERLVKIVHELREKCPWDKKQTHRTLIPYLLEEAYETVEAIESKNKENVGEELGDLLLQIVLHAELLTEKTNLSFDKIAKGIADKMVRRHPHIYGDAKYKDLKSHLKRWSDVKKAEKPKKMLLDGTPKAMPGLQLSQRYCDIAASVGFDWPALDNVMDKVDEEIAELKVELKRKKKQTADIEMEFGDLLFTLTRVAGHLKIDSERALKRSAQKFQQRFTAMEKHFQNQGQSLSKLPLKEMEKMWEEIKRKDKASAL
jgi:MazG family protein